MKKIYVPPFISVVAVGCTNITAATTEISVNNERQSEPDDEMFSKQGNMSLWDNEVKW